MRFLKPFLPALLVALAFTYPLRAQHVDAYLTLNITHLGTAGTGFPQSAPPFVEQFKSITPIGTGGGVSYTVFHVPFAAIDVDVRGAFRDGYSGQDDGLFGIKLAFNHTVRKLKPYVQGSGGFLAARTANISSVASGYAKSDGTFTTHYAVYEFFGGLDYPIKGHLDARILEVGGGSSFGASPNTSLFTVNSGLLLHF